MPSDYEAICQRNIREYGEGTRHLDLLQGLYAERTHFILELLQNAEDARATRVAFTVHADRLVVGHDGRPFDENDVVGICGVNASAKTGELTGIGKFGIGFKSVYAYTRTPEIHSVDEHFRVRHYVRPEPVEAPPDLTGASTRFVFPFDRDDIPAEQASTEIETALRGLDPVVLLFLRHIVQVTVQGSGSGIPAEQPPPRLTLARTSPSADDPTRVELLVRHDDRTVVHQYWWVFRRDLDDDRLDTRRVEIAFRRTGPAPDAPIERLARAPLAVFFPTDKQTGLGFLLQAPLRTTPARDNVPAHDPDNAKIIGEAAVLLIDALRELRDRGRLGLDVYDTLPIIAEDFPEGSLLRPLFDALCVAIRDHALLPVADPVQHAPARQVRLARTGGVRALLTPQQLSSLAGSADPLFWQPEQFTRDRSPHLWEYMRHIVGIDEITPEWVVGQLSADMLVAADDEWLIRLYAFLTQSPHLWRATRPPVPPGPARLLPLIRLEDGTHVAPFDSHDRAQAHLPAATPSTFATVRRAIAANPQALSFLRDLGLSEPDTIDEVIQHILPRYPSEHTSVDDQQHERDLDIIARAWSTATAARRKTLAEALRATPFLIATTATGDGQTWQTPANAYWPDDDLRHYFRPNPHAWFLHPRYQRHHDLLVDLGVTDRPRAPHRQPGPNGHVTIRSNWGDHYRGLHGFDPDLRIDGLDTALANPDRQRSAYIWNQILLPHASRLRGTVETSGRQEFIDSDRQPLRSEPLRLATTHAWLPTAEGSYAPPSELSLKDLPADFAADQTLADILDMVGGALEQVSAELNLPVHVLRFLAENPQVVDKLARQAQTTEHPADKDRASARFTPTDYRTELQHVFKQPAAHPQPSSEHSPVSGRVNDPDLRRERTREAMTTDLAAEPSLQERFQLLNRRVWNAKNPAVRQFLLEQYAGRCQICTAAFPKRDGSPYFEAIYLVGHTNAAWIDRPGNTLCLCPTCAAKIRHAHVEADDIIEQILQWRTSAEHGADTNIRIHLCGHATMLAYTEKHLLDLQEMINSGSR